MIWLFIILSSFLFGQNIEQYDRFDDFETHLIQEKDKIYVVNYWATWCAPCVKELPYFEELNASRDDVIVVFVSIDFKNQYEKRLIPFVEKRELKSRLIHLADPKTNDWIDRVDPSWSGAIPATQIIYGDKKVFLEQSFEDRAALEKEIDSILDN